MIFRLVGYVRVYKSVAMLLLELYLSNQISGSLSYMIIIAFVILVCYAVWFRLKRQRRITVLGKTSVGNKFMGGRVPLPP